MKNCKSNVLQKKNMLILIFVGYCFAVLVKTVIFLAPFKCSDFILASSVETSETSLSCRHKKDDTIDDNLLPQDKTEKNKKVHTVTKNLWEKYGNCCKVVLCIFLALCLANLLFFIIPFSNSKDNSKTDVSFAQESNLQSKPFLITYSRSDCEKRIKYVSKKRKKEKSISKSGSNCFYNSQKKIPRINAKDSVLLSEMYENGPHFKETLFFDYNLSDSPERISLYNFLNEWVFNRRKNISIFMQFLNKEIQEIKNWKASLFDNLTENDICEFYKAISPNSCFVPSDFSIDTFINVFVNNIPFAKMECNLSESRNLECFSTNESTVEAWKFHIDNIFQNDEKKNDYKLSISQWNYSVFKLYSLLYKKNKELDATKTKNLQDLEFFVEMLHDEETKCIEYIRSRFDAPLEQYKSLKDSNVNVDILLDTIFYGEYQDFVCK